MKGKILDYSISESKGLISGADGNRYSFTNSEWRSDKAPAKNQIVDFEIDGTSAKGIYLESGSTLNTDEIKEKFAQIKNSDTVQNVGNTINKKFKDGVQNMFGFVVSLILAIALFFPVIEIPLLGSASLVDGGWGKISLFGTIVVAILFYTGAKHNLVKIAVGVTSFIILVQFYDLFSDLNSGEQFLNAFSGSRNNINLFQLISFGTYVIIPLAILLLFAGFKKNYNEKL